MNYPWKIKDGSNTVASGVIEAETEREAMADVLEQNAEGRIADKSYTITVGSLTGSSYGDEFTRTSEVTGWGNDEEQEPLECDGYLFKAKPEDVLTPEQLADIWDQFDKACDMTAKSAQGLSDAVDRACPDTVDRTVVKQQYRGTPPTCKHHNMNGEATNPLTGEIHAWCVDCGHIAEHGTGRFDNDYPKTGRLNASEPNISNGPKGQDAIIGRALESGKKGDTINIRLNWNSHYRGVLGSDAEIGEGLRAGGDGRFYRPNSKVEVSYATETTLGSGLTTTSRTPLYPTITETF